MFKGSRFCAQCGAKAIRALVNDAKPLHCPRCRDTMQGMLLAGIRPHRRALGLVAHFAVRGRTAMTADSVSKVLVRQIAEPLPPVQSVRQDLPSALADAIDRCLAKDPADRFPRAESLVEALDAAQLAPPEIPVAIRLFAQEAGTRA